MGCQAVRLLVRSAALQAIEHFRNRGMCLAQLARSSSPTAITIARRALPWSLRLIKGGQSSTRTCRQLAVARNDLDGCKVSTSLRETFDLLTHHIA